MKEDKKLHELLSKWAMEEPAADFNRIVMQRIEAIETAKLPATPFLKNKLIKVLIGVFAAVTILLLVWCFSGHPLEVPVYFTAKLPETYTSQIISFLLVFWVVLLSNQLISRKENIQYE